eukprot:gene3477-biopygen11264
MQRPVATYSFAFRWSVVFVARKIVAPVSAQRALQRQGVELSIPKSTLEQWNFTGQAQQFRTAPAAPDGTRGKESGRQRHQTPGVEQQQSDRTGVLADALVETERDRDAGGAAVGVHDSARAGLQHGRRCRVVHFCLSLWPRLHAAGAHHTFHTDGTAGGLRGQQNHANCGCRSRRHPLARGNGR